IPVPRTRTTMAQCVTCGSELHPERAQKYDYCTKRECRQLNARPLTIAAVGVNKAADQYLVLNDQAKEDLAAGKYQDQRKSSSVTDGPRHKRAQTPSPPPHPPPRPPPPQAPPDAPPPPQAHPPTAHPAATPPLLDQVPGGPRPDLQHPRHAPRRDRRAPRREPLHGHPDDPGREEPREAVTFASSCSYASPSGLAMTTV